MKQKYNGDKKYLVELTEEQMAMLKGGLVYLINDNEFGAGTWMTYPGACWGRTENESFIKAGDLYSKLEKLSSVKPEFGDWGDIERLVEIFNKEYLIYKKQGEEAERVMYEEAIKNERNT